MMKRLRRYTRWLSCMVLGASMAAVGLYVASRLSGPALQPWHTWYSDYMYRADPDRVSSFSEYLELEALQFSDLDRFLQGEETPGISRYSPHNILGMRVKGQDWNRTVELPAASPRGGVLMLHGMSDSPYSMRTLAQLLHQHGFHVLALRLPGHGTVPAGLTRAGWKEMAAAVRLAMEHLRQQMGPGEPLYMIGYSNGAALALEYALSAEQEGRDEPAALALVSPAIAVTPAARLSWLFMQAGRLPGLRQLEWLSVQPEYDPYKYNSFPVNAGYQVYRLAGRVQELLRSRLEREGMGGFPPVLVIQSVVDDTVSAPAVVEQLMSRLDSGSDELLLFDVNRDSRIVSLFAEDNGDRVEALLEQPAPYAMTLVTNRDPDEPRVWALHRPPGGGRISSELLDLQWPPGVYSLSHVALPFPVDDPVYGVGSEEQPTLGQVELRGESSLLRIPVQQLMRLRYNPFHAYMTQRILDFLDGTERAGRAQPAPAKRR